MTDIEIPAGFTRWDGGDCPEFEILFRDGSMDVVRNPDIYTWKHYGKGHDIIAYRIVSP